MPISYLGSVIGNKNNGGDVALNLTGMSLQDGDYVIVIGGIGDNDGVDFTMAMVTSGYTKVADLHADDDQDCDLGVFWKKMGATPDTGATFDGQGGNDAAVAAIALGFRGVDDTTPMDVAPTTATGVNSNRPNPPSIDYIAASGVWTIAIGAFGHTSGAQVTVTAPTNYVNKVDEGGNDTSDITVCSATRSDPADPEDPGIFTPSIGDDVAHSWCAVTIALRPTAGTAYELDCAPSSYVYTGVAATTGWGRTIDAQPASYVYTGIAATLSHIYNMDAEPSSYVYTGLAATLGFGRVMNAEPSSYTYAGVAATLTYGTVYEMNAEPSSYVYTGVAATLAAARNMDAGPGSYTYTGIAATLGRVFELDAGPGSYTYSGVAAILVRGIVIPADPTTYNYTGVAATLVYLQAGVSGKRLYAVGRRPARRRQVW